MYGKLICSEICSFSPSLVTAFAGWFAHFPLFQVEALKNRSALGVATIDTALL